MNVKTKSLAGLMSLAVISSIVVLSADLAWSESPRKHASKKHAFKKAKVAKKKTLTQSMAPEAAAVVPIATAQAMPASTPVATTQAVPAPTPVAAKPDAPAAAPASANPYMNGQYPDPWKVEVAKPVPVAVNPYLAYRYAAPVTTPWNTIPTPAPRYTPPVWGNPFLAFQAPFPKVPAAPVTPWNLPVVQAPQFPIQPAFNPYLPRSAPVAVASTTPSTPPTPWTPPTYQVPHYTPPALPAAPSIPPVAAQATPWTPPVFQAPQALPQFGNPAGNPYLAYRQAPVQPASPAAATTPAVAPAVAPTPAQNPAPTPWSLPSLPFPAQAASGNQATSGSLGNFLESLKYALVPGMPSGEQSILPVIKTVYPTGEKPLKVLTFKCPTELLGVTPIPVKAVHGLVNLAMDGINSTDLLPFNMQQVCQ